MDEEKKEPFLFSLAVVFALSLAVFAFFCGGDFMKMGWCKVITFIYICLFFVMITVFLGFILFSKSDDTNVKTWITYSNNFDTPKDTERLTFFGDCGKIEKQFDLKKLQIVEFDSKDIEVDENTFSKCKNIEEVTFYQKPNVPPKNAFSKCTSLKKVKLVGNCNDWTDFQITVPTDCEITFLSTKEIVIPEKISERIIDDLKITIVNGLNSVFSTEHKNKNETSPADSSQREQKSETEEKMVDETFNNSKTGENQK